MKKVGYILLIMLMIWQADAIEEFQKADILTWFYEPGYKTIVQSSYNRMKRVCEDKCWKDKKCRGFNLYKSNATKFYCKLWKRDLGTKKDSFKRFSTAVK